MLNIPSHKRNANQKYIKILPPVRRAIINNATTNAGKDVEKKKHYPLFVGMQMNTTTVESSMEVPQKTKNRTQ
jgi:hypothetical protein